MMKRKNAKQTQQDDASDQNAGVSLAQQMDVEKKRGGSPDLVDIADVLTSRSGLLNWPRFPQSTTGTSYVSERMPAKRFASHPLLQDG